MLTWTIPLILRKKTSLYKLLLLLPLPLPFLSLIIHRLTSSKLHITILLSLVPLWVTELLTGHPKHVRHELGVHKHVFRALIVALQDAGYTPSKFITLEEQLAIFLYICITGLSLGHICECFQQATDMASKYVP